MQPSAVIEAIDCFLPEIEVQNAHFMEYLNTSDSWIKSRTGISTRYWAGPNTSTSDLAVAAGRRVLEKIQDPTRIDLLLLCTTTPDHPCPATAPEIAFRLGLQGIPAFDIAAVCSGFVYGLSIASAYIKSGLFNNILVIAAETYSTILDKADRTTSVIFGDGAGAVVLRRGEFGEAGNIIGFKLGSDGEHKSSIIIAKGGSRSRASTDKQMWSDEFFRMQGKEIFNLAVQRMSECSQSLLTEIGWDREDVSWFVAHQANERILKMVAESLKIPPETVVININKVGNTSAASIPLALCDAKDCGLLKQGDRILIASFGGGVTWGAAAFTWPNI